MIAKKAPAFSSRGRPLKRPYTKIFDVTKPYSYDLSNTCSHDLSNTCSYGCNNLYKLHPDFYDTPEKVKMNHNYVKLIKMCLLPISIVVVLDHVKLNSTSSLLREDLLVIVVEQNQSTIDEMKKTDVYKNNSDRIKIVHSDILDFMDNTFKEYNHLIGILFDFECVAIETSHRGYAVLTRMLNILTRKQNRIAIGFTYCRRLGKLTNNGFTKVGVDERVDYEFTQYLTQLNIQEYGIMRSMTGVLPFFNKIESDIYIIEFNRKFWL